MSRPDEHPAWCAGGHRCNLGEHRAEPVTLDDPQLGRLVLTRVSDRQGHEHAEVLLTVPLDGTETVARKQLLALTRDLHTVLSRARRRLMV